MDNSDNCSHDAADDTNHESIATTVDSCIASGVVDADPDDNSNLPQDCAPTSTPAASEVSSDYPCDCANEELQPLIELKSDLTESKVDEKTAALIHRKQPLLELVSSEESYVRRLRMVKDVYIPILSQTKGVVSSMDGPTVLGTSLNTSDPPIATRDISVSSSPPSMPDDLAARWRILWGNSIQLFEWHSSFLEKVKHLVNTDPDKIPKLFIDSRARLRSIYSKYCENHRKAALIADQYRDYFEELRTYLNEKEDVVSYLIQPVQRIMRYQLPMAEIVKYTQRAGSPDLLLWKRALDIMKEIPKDTQLILEAARIDGFPGVITALGNILIRGDLVVATSSREQVLETVAGYKATLQEGLRLLGISDPSSPMSKIANVHAHPNRLTTWASPTSPTETSGTLSSVSSSGPFTESPGQSELSDLYTGSLKFVESRLFLFEQMLLVTEEVKPKRRMGSSDAYAQSTYLFRAAVNVNKMRFEPHWYNCSLPNGVKNADAVAVDHLLSLGLAPDDLRFAIQDQTPGREVIYVIDPTTCANREAWVVQLRDIQRMQHEFLLALQDPRRFNASNLDDIWDLPTSAGGEHLSAHPDSHPPLVSVRNDPTAPPQTQRQRKWPTSFTMKRPGRLGSSSSPTSSKDSTSKPPIPSLSPSVHESSGECASGALGRSLSVERGAVSRTKRDTRTSVCESKFSATGGPHSTCNNNNNNKSSVAANNSLKSTDLADFTDGADASVAESAAAAASGGGGGGGGSTKSSGSVGKKRGVFANFFNWSKSKHRTRSHTGQPPCLTTITMTPPRPTTSSPSVCTVERDDADVVGTSD